MAPLPTTAMRSRRLTGHPLGRGGTLTHRRMGVSCASQQSCPTMSELGPISSFSTCADHFRSTPINRQIQSRPPLRKSANTSHSSVRSAYQAAQLQMQPGSGAPVVRSLSANAAGGSRWSPSRAGLSATWPRAILCRSNSAAHYRNAGPTSYAARQHRLGASSACEHGKGNVRRGLTPPANPGERRDLRATSPARRCLAPRLDTMRADDLL